MNWILSVLELIKEECELLSYEPDPWEFQDNFPIHGRDL